MTYSDSEKSKHSGKPLELYRYAGTYQTFRYTSSPVPVSYQAPDETEPFVYTPLATRRSAVQHTTQNDDTSEVTIDLPVTSELVAIYGFQISPPDLYLTLFRGHNPGEFIRYWQGNVENISVVRGTATIRVPSPLAAALSTEFPTVYFQTPCNHNLFDDGCTVPVEDWTVTTAIVSVDGTVIEVTPASVGALDGQLVGGDAVLASGERRMITAQAGDTITINYPFASANEDDALVLLTGCDLALMGDCKNRYDNTINHGGFGFIPSKNVFKTGLEPGKDVTDETCLPFVPVFEGWYIKVRVSWINASTPEPYLGAEAGTELITNLSGKVIVPFEYIEWTSTDPDSYVPGDAYVQVQFAFGTVSGPMKGVVSYRRWDDPDYTTAIPLPGSDSPDEGGGIFACYNLFVLRQVYNF